MNSTGLSQLQNNTPFEFRTEYVYVIIHKFYSTTAVTARDRDKGIKVRAQRSCEGDNMMDDRYNIRESLRDGDGEFMTTRADKKRG